MVVCICSVSIALIFSLNHSVQIILGISHHMSSISTFIRLRTLFWKNEDMLKPILKKLPETLPKIGDKLKKSRKFTSEASAMLKTTDMLEMPKLNTIHLIKQTQNQMTKLGETFGTAGNLFHTKNYFYWAGKVFRLKPPLPDDEMQYLPP